MRKLPRIFPLPTSLSLFTWNCKICPWEISILPGLVGTSEPRIWPPVCTGVYWGGETGQLWERACIQGAFGGQRFWGDDLSLSKHSVTALCKTYGVSAVPNWAVCHFPSYLSALKQSRISWDLNAAQMSKTPPCLPQLAACLNRQRCSAWKPSLCQMGFIFLEESLNSHYSWFFFDFSDFYWTWSLSATSHWKEERKHTARDINFINFVGSATYRLKNPELPLGSCTARPQLRTSLLLLILLSGKELCPLPLETELRGCKFSKITYWLSDFETLASHFWAYLVLWQQNLRNWRFSRGHSITNSVIFWTAIGKNTHVWEQQGEGRSLLPTFPSGTHHWRFLQGPVAGIIWDFFTPVMERWFPLHSFSFSCRTWI